MQKWLQKAGYMHFFSNIDDTTFIVENYKKACLTKFYGFQNECFQNSKYLLVFVKEKLLLVGLPKAMIMYSTQIH